MPDTEFIAVILLLVAAVAFGYFYLKRAQRRDHPVTPTKVEYPDASAAPVGSASTSSATTDETPRRDGAGPG